VTDNYTYTAPTKLLEMLDKAGDRIMGLLEGKMKPNSDGALVVPTAGSSMTEGNSKTGEPPFGSKASRMHQPKSKPDRPKPKAKLFRRKGE
jgi:hypothetical protein